jgi:PAS domain S-box-containing protein
MFWLVFERTDNPVLLLDEQRRIVEVNQAAVRLLGAERDVLIGSSIRDSVKPSERPRSDREWWEFLSSGEYSGCRDLIRADGSELQVDFAARLADLGGNRYAIYVLIERVEPGSRPTPRPEATALTSREREVVTLIALGRDTAEIAAELHVSPETVRTHVRNAMAKLDVHTRAQLVAVVLCAEHAIDSSICESIRPAEG